MDAPQHRVPIPRREHLSEDPGRGLIIIAAVTHKMKVLSPLFIAILRLTRPQIAFSFLLQSEDGDLYKVTHEDEDVKALNIKYFDTVPVASSLRILKSGFLFVASGFGNRCVSFIFAVNFFFILFSLFYQFQKLGDDDNKSEFSSTSYPACGMANPTLPLPRAYFRPRPLENLVIADELESLDPILDSKVLNLLPNSDSLPIFRRVVVVLVVHSGHHDTALK